MRREIGDAVSRVPIQKPLAVTREAAPPAKFGQQPDYCSASILTCLTMKVLFGMALRQTKGFVGSLLRLSGLDWTVPNISTPSRRQKALRVNRRVSVDSKHRFQSRDRCTTRT